MRSKILRALEKRFSVCPTCLAILKPQSVFCGFCTHLIHLEISKTQSSRAQEQSGLRIRSLFYWGESSLQIVPSLIYALKGGEFHRAFHWLAHQFAIVHQLHSLPPESRPVFVAIPGKKDDHAAQWASALSLVVPALTCRVSQIYATGQGLNSQVKQRHKSREQRRQVRHAPLSNRIKNQSLLFRSRNVILCDDVVTTGSTALATQALLKGNPATEVWCIAYRPQVWT